MGTNMDEEMLLNWSLLLIVGIYRDIKELLKFEDELSKTFTDVFEILNENLEIDSFNRVTIGNYGVFDFGIAKIVNKDNLNLHLEYIASNNFEKGTFDVIPKIFLQKEITEDFFKITHGKYYNESKVLYNDENYEKLYLDLIKKYD
ncbi:MAG: hypothetical protein BGO42_17435 [Flavobacterium sp. 40-81]|nr:MAG: hypothetical protein BGO42_17435 [Flavobacterium sp. 40-81]